MKILISLLVLGALVLAAAKIESRSVKDQGLLCTGCQFLAVVSVALLGQEHSHLVACGILLALVDAAILFWISHR
ncbi:MAG: hypothetical protein JNN17_04765 [Verrucomicrobiaceae bacterium]|nr:hypothetical protein [Verrucomicrobiaceae bacterium]